MSLLLLLLPLWPRLARGNHEDHEMSLSSTEASRYSVVVVGGVIVGGGCGVVDGVFGVVVKSVVGVCGVVVIVVVL